MTHHPPRPTTRPSRTVAGAVWLLAAAATVTVLLVAAASAEGGTYRAVQCNPALGAGRADATFSRNSGHYTSKGDCEAGGGLVVRHDATSSRRGRWGAWSLQIPSGTEAIAFAAGVAGTAAGGHMPSLTATSGGGAAAAFGRATGPAHTVRWAGAEGSSFEARLECERSRCERAPSARVIMRRISLRLSDELRPEASMLGPLAGVGTVRGEQSLTALAEDLGAGVRELFLEVNGQPIGARKIDCELRGRIATRLRPCPANVERTWDLDTEGRGFRQGLNHIDLCADDLALGGVSNRDCARHRVRVDNECPLDGIAEAGVLRARLTGAGRSGSTPHDRPPRVLGTLTDSSGRPIAGAEVCVGAEVAGLPGRAERIVATPRTGANGGFEVRLDPGPNRDVRVAHWSRDGEVSERYLRLRVRARPSLRISPRALRNGGTVRFRARLHGPDPGGRRVQLEVLDGGWRILRAHNSAPSGIWRDSYRFTSTTGTRTYAFRAVVPRQAGYPYERGSSRVRRVTVRG